MHPNVQAEAVTFNLHEDPKQAYGVAFSIMYKNLQGVIDNLKKQEKSLQEIFGVSTEEYLKSPLAETLSMFADMMTDRAFVYLTGVVANSLQAQKAAKEEGDAATALQVQLSMLSVLSGMLPLAADIVGFVGAAGGRHEPVADKFQKFLTDLTQAMGLDPAMFCEASHPLH